MHQVLMELEDPEYGRRWREQARCHRVDPELFFPGAGDSRNLAAAKNVCSGCPVRSECLDYAMRNREKFGVWGGLSERERNRLRKRNPDSGHSRRSADRHIF